MSRLYVCDWCERRFLDREEIFGLTVNDGPGESTIPNGVHVCLDCFPEEPAAPTVIEEGGED